MRFFSQQQYRHITSSKWFPVRRGHIRLHRVNQLLEISARDYCAAIDRRSVAVRRAFAKPLDRNHWGIRRDIRAGNQFI